MRRRKLFRDSFRKRLVCVSISDERGLSLLETILALAILAIGIAGVLHTFSNSMLATKEAESFSTASVLANRVASDLNGRKDLSSGSSSGTFDDESAYQWDADVSPADSDGLMKTDISITWHAGNNPRKYEMVTYLYPGINQQASVDTSSSTSSSGGK